MDISLAEAKAQLSALVDRAREGETIRILRHGKPVARLLPVEPESLPINVERLRKLTASMSLQQESAGDFMRRLRDDERY